MQTAVSDALVEYVRSRPRQKDILRFDTADQAREAAQELRRQHPDVRELDIYAENAKVVLKIRKEEEE